MIPMKRLKCHVLVIPVAVGLLASSGAARAQDRWDWIVAPYVWAVDISTDLETPPPASAAITRRLSFGDVVDKLDGAFQMHAEGQGEHLGVFADFTYLGLSQSSTRRLFQADSDLDTRLFEATAVWSPGGQRFTEARSSPGFVTWIWTSPARSPRRGPSECRSFAWNWTNRSTISCSAHVTHGRSPDAGA